MANGTIKKLPIKISTPDVIESVSFTGDLPNYLIDGRLLQLEVTLTDAVKESTGFQLFQIVFSKTNIRFFGLAIDGSWTLFGTIS